MASTSTKAKTRRTSSKNTSTRKSPAKGNTKRTKSINKNSSSNTSSARLTKTENQIKKNNQNITIILFAFSILLMCLIFVRGDHLWRCTHDTLKGLFGSCAILLPVLTMYISIATALEQPTYKVNFRIWVSFWLITLISTAVYIFEEPILVRGNSYFDKLGELYVYGMNQGVSGLIGGILGIPFLNFVGSIGSKITIILIIFVMIMLLTGTNLMQLFHFIVKPASMFKETYDSMRLEKEEYTESEFNNIPKVKQKRKSRNTNIDIDLGPAVSEENLPNHPVASPLLNELEESEKVKKESKLEKLKLALKMGLDDNNKKTKKYDDRLIQNSKNNLPEIDEDLSGAASAAQAYMNKSEKMSIEGTDCASTEKDIKSDRSTTEYKYPPISLLKPSEVLDQGDIKEELQTYGQMLVDTLKSFGVQTKIVDINRGPAVTRFELQPAAGVKVSKITNLADDIALNLAALGVRIEAPIPGKAAVGIEVPNKTVNIVKMRELIASKAFSSTKSKLSVALGCDIAGNVTIADLSKMPHLLIAGSTGSGKSVCINSLVISLLYKSSPDEVRLLMIDPKVVELGIYNGIPHLLVPVVTDPRKAAGALNWAVTEMLKRYKTFAEYNVRNLESYNKMVIKTQNAPKETSDECKEKLELMPQIVIIIDELSDLMMAAPNEVEDAICRLAQMARAAGMHLVIATQRPSVDVITGIIKANIPSRIAFAVSSQIDSRTILDMGGAEKLLGRGDMLFYPIGSSKPIRVQGCYVTNEEIEEITDFVKNNDKASYDDNIIDEIEKNAIQENKKNKALDDSSEHDEDPMLKEAIKCVVEAGQASTSLLQRRLRLGYARAGRLIDEMEQMAIVGPHEGSKPRQVLITYNQWLEMNVSKSDE